MENNKKLTRSRKERMIAGVCGGIAEYMGWDRTLVRIVYVLATIFTAFAGVIIYLILWIIMPVESYSDGYGDTYNKKDLPVLPRRVTEHDSRQNPVGHHPGQADHPVRNPQGILFSRFPGRAEPRRAQPFGHERSNPRQITIAYVI